MKKALFVIIILFAIMTFTFASAANGKNENVLQEPAYSESIKKFIQTFNLPSSLKKIESEAFEGTSITNVILPDKVNTIGDRAFANIKTLRSILIPVATRSIAKSAFVGSSNITINAVPNSYARRWAKENRFPFSPITVMNAGAGGQNVAGFLVTTSKEVLDTESPDILVTNRTWKKYEELQHIDTIEIIENVIQGRAPPLA